MAYCTLQAARRQLETSSTVDNQTVADLLLDASQMIDDICGQWFDERIQTIAFSGEVGTTNPTLGLDGWPLISVDTLLNGDGSTISSSNYDLLPIGRYPKTGIRLDSGNYWLSPDASANCASWLPTLDVGYAEDAIRVTGKWGYHRRYGMGGNAWVNTGLTVSGAYTANTLSLVLSGAAAALIDVGDVLRIDSEYFYVSGPVASTSAATTLTVTPAYNGSTAANHTNGTAIYVWRTEYTIAWACREIVAAAYKSRDNATGTQMNAGGIGSMTISDVPTKVLEKLRWPFATYQRGMPVGALK